MSWISEYMAGAGRRREQADEKRRLNNAEREARIKEKNAKTEARAKNGGAGFSVTFYELEGPKGPGGKVRVKRR